MKNCTARQCSPLRRNFMERSIINPALSLLMKHLVIGQHQKAPNFSAFHWSRHSSLLSIGKHFVTTRVVHLPKRTETCVIAESDKSGHNDQLCTARTAWSDVDQAVRAVHSCKSWLCAFKAKILEYIFGEKSRPWSDCSCDQGLLKLPFQRHILGTFPHC